MTESRYHVPGFFGKMIYKQGVKEDQKRMLDLCDGEHTAAEIAKKLGNIRKLKIIGVPSGMDEKIALKEIKKILKNF